MSRVGRPSCARDKTCRPSSGKRSLNKQRARAIRTPTYLGAMSRKQESSLGSKASAMTQLYEYTSGTSVVRRDTTTGTEILSRSSPPLGEHNLAVFHPPSRAAKSLRVPAAPDLFSPSIFHKATRKKVATPSTKRRDSIFQFAGAWFTG